MKSIMTMNRRTFLGQMAMSTLIPVVGRAADQKIQRLGLQLYTVRTEMEKDFEGTLAKVAAAGYQEVEFAGYFKQDPKNVRAILDRHKLTAPSAHVDYPTVESKLDQALEAARIIGHRFLVNPWIDEEMRKQPDIWQRVAATFNKAGEACRKAGVQFAYHNHHFEFVPVNGVMPFDLLLKECDPKLVKMELDLGWAHEAGTDPLKWFAQYPGRFPLVHVKDFEANGTMTEVGKGEIDWKAIFAKANLGGIKHYFVEHDDPKAPFDSIQASYEYLEKLRF